MGAVEAAGAETVWEEDLASGRQKSEPGSWREMPGPRWIAEPARGGEAVAGEDAAIFAARDVRAEGKGGRWFSRIGVAWLQSSDASLFGQCIFLVFLFPHFGFKLLFESRMV